MAQALTGRSRVLAALLGALLLSALLLTIDEPTFIGNA